MTTENANKIVDFLQFLNGFTASTPMDIEIEERDCLGTVLLVHTDNSVYRNQLNVLMSILDTITTTVAIQVISNKGKLVWKLW